MGERRERVGGEDKGLERQRDNCERELIHVTLPISTQQFLTCKGGKVAAVTRFGNRMILIGAEIHL